ncbi:MAG TPA: hypothetical protein VHD90_11875, partial [Phototrophicaceae bacterium]|nr:hypothetical protein [Phototrophicaceae bacterium]
MTWAFVIILIAIVVIMTLSNAVPWANRMRRLRKGKTEWMAPDDVIEQVREQYLEAINWLNESMLMSWTQQLTAASAYLSGSFLRRYRNLLLSQRSARGVQLTGVLRADHNVEVRQFSENGGFCLVVDHQTQRRMATYNHRTQERLHTQDMGDGVVVYAMLYDSKEGRWKIG